jgi:hypothetical protein
VRDAKWIDHTNDCVPSLELMDATNAALSYAGSALSGVVRQVGGYAVFVVQSVDTY